MHVSQPSVSLSCYSLLNLFPLVSALIWNFNIMRYFDLKKREKSVPPPVKPTRLLHQRCSRFTQVSNVTDGEKGRRRIGVLRLLVCLIIYFMYYGTPRINLCPFCACLHNFSNRSTRYVNKRREAQQLIYSNITHVIFLFLGVCFAWLVSLRHTDHSIQPFIPSLRYISLQSLFLFHNTSQKQ